MQISPTAQDFYDPRFEHDACGMACGRCPAVRRSHKIITDALTVVGKPGSWGRCEVNSGDEPGILLQIPHRFLAVQCQELGFSCAGRSLWCGIYSAQDRAAQERCQMVWQRIVVRRGSLCWVAHCACGTIVWARPPGLSTASSKSFIGRGADVADDIDSSGACI